MSNQRGPRLSRRDRQEASLDRLRRDVQNQGLLDALDSFPAPESFTFQHTRKSGHDTIMLCLGTRANTGSSTCEAWARIVTAERKDLNPPVVFYCQELSEDGTRTFQYPRSASSLLRKAAGLQPPFCFLQHDPFDEATGVRDMLCAVILYQALVTGVETCALQWAQFGDSLSQALRYIDSRDAYHQWRHEQKIAAIRRPASNEASKQHTQKEAEKETDEVRTDEFAAEELRTVSATSRDEYTGGVVRPSGSRIVVKPNTSLSKLKEQLGDAKFQNLDNLPSRPMTISPHSLGEPYFPFRMLVGTHSYEDGEPAEVYVYLTHDGPRNAAMRFLSHDTAGEEVSWTIDELQDITLFEPFEYLNNLKLKSNGTRPGISARAAKIRSVISYYFFLAENEGLIGDPRVTIGEAFGKRLCAACKELQEVDFYNNDNGGSDESEDNHNDDTNIEIPVHKLTEPVYEAEEANTELARQEESDNELTRIVRLRIQPETLKDIIRSGPIKYRGAIPDGETAQEQGQTRFDKLPLEETPGEDVPTLQLGMRPSPQVTYEASQSLMNNLSNQVDTLIDVVEAETSRKNGPHKERAHTPNKTAGSDIDGDQRCHDVSSILHDAISHEESELEKLQQIWAAFQDFRNDMRAAGMTADNNNLELWGLNQPGMWQDPPEYTNEVNRIRNRLKALGKQRKLLNPDEFDATSAADTTATEEEGAIARMSSVHATAIGTTSEFQETLAIDGVGAGTETKDPRPSADKPTQDPHTILSEIESEDESIPMDICSEPSPARSRSRTPWISMYKSRANSISDDALMSGLDASLLVAKVLDNKPSTPEGSAERDLKAQTAADDATEALPEAFENTELSSDDEVDKLALLASRNVVERTPEARNRPVDLTQLSSSPRGKKRKSGPSHVPDSDDDDIIEEKDGRDWLRKSLNRRR
ncbi:hypothetical protein BU25DRAFT_493950 [Macroventuria anomochaeta]|uniref:Uncharacterized protein n=1 Tax=Macroventuria anomochaeta TaxID=301207 RepID=A0ACB6RSD7_9PLEO|nr:uncharacterized protein BU25DRAFT_493950 [Macroventuria anomochaeta]KAF2624059.1 hypothetical protein BU25DRAFT_493950 [Macroventuria anomochaeta]